MTTLVVALCGVILFLIGVIVFLICVVSMQNKEFRDQYTPVEPPDIWEDANYERY